MPSTKARYTKQLLFRSLSALLNQAEQWGYEVRVSDGKSDISVNESNVRLEDSEPPYGHVQRFPWQRLMDFINREHHDNLSSAQRCAALAAVLSVIRDAPEPKRLPFGLGKVFKWPDQYRKWWRGRLSEHSGKSITELVDLLACLDEIQKAAKRMAESSDVEGPYFALQLKEKGGESVKEERLYRLSQYRR